MLDKAPRAASKKIRKYEQVDLTREFEIRQERREQAKKEKLEELYVKHDNKVSKMKDLVFIEDEEAKGGDRTDLSEWERMTDGDDTAQSKRLMRREIQD